MAVLDTTGSSAGSLIVLDVSDRARARAFLTSVGAPPGGTFRGATLYRQPSGTAVHQLSLAPGFQLDYALTHGLVVASTSLAGVAAAIYHVGGPDHEPDYGWAFGQDSGPFTSLLFFDLNQLLRLGEQTGLIGSARLSSLSPDLQQIRAVGVATRSGTDTTTTELALQMP